MKKLTIRQFATIKRVAQNVNPLVVKKNKAISKIAELQEEIKGYEREIAGHEAGIKALTDGFTSEDLVFKTVEETDKTDAKGNVIKVTKYLPTDMISFSDEENCYYIVAEPRAVATLDMIEGDME